MNKQNGFSKIALILTVLVVGLVVYLVTNKPSKVYEDQVLADPVSQEATENNEISENRDFGDDGLEDSDGKGGTLSEPVSLGTVKSFTLAEVATHNSSSSCWTVVNGSVYDVTNWIARHPGGQGAIKGMCGVDATSAFSSQHGGESRPESTLASFKIGVLK